MREVIMALDWTPNTNHTGLYLAKAKGYYREEGLDVRFISPHVCDFARTPASIVENGQATFACAPCEAVISYSLTPDRPKMQAIAAILCRDASRVVTLKSSGIHRPSGLDGKIYASYAARFEGGIIQQMIRNDGGKGSFIENVPDKLDSWGALLEGKASAAWVFHHWQNVEADLNGIDLNVFHLQDYGVPYGLSPVIFGKKEELEKDPELPAAFLRASEKGYLEATKDARAAVEIFLTAVSREHMDDPVHLDVELVRRSQDLVNEYYLETNGKWGRICHKTMSTFVDWLVDNQLLSTLIEPQRLAETTETTFEDLETDNDDVNISNGELDLVQIFTNKYF